MAEESELSEALNHYKIMITDLEKLLRLHFAEFGLCTDFGHEAYWLHHTIFSNLNGLKHAGVNDVTGLETYVRALGILSGIVLSDHAYDMMRSRALKRLHDQSGLGERIISQTDREIWKSILNDNLTFRFLMRDNDLISDLIEICRDVREEIKSTTTGKEKQENILGWQTVDTCRIQWARVTGKRPPRSGFSPGSKFGEYLQDVWELFEVNENLGAAYNAWYRKFKNKQDPTDSFFL
ncbi:MAG: hypothetical protein OEN23_04425 [Paracoccaceae bacterium]|nr:hypothetical protein [Paracoccaceae bacterium]